MLLPRIYAVLDTATLERHGAQPVSVAEALLDGGIRLLQFRHKGAFSREVYRQAAEVGRRCAEAGAAYVIDDRADVARLLDAGVHVGQADLPPALARRVLPVGLIGLSTHNEAQLRDGDLEPVDYLAIGPVFATGSKQNPDSVVVVEALPQLRKLTSKPLVAIGGITCTNAAAVFATGIDSIAVIGELLAEGCDPGAVRRRAEALGRL